MDCLFCTGMVADDSNNSVFDLLTIYTEYNMKTYLTIGAISALLLALSFIGGCQYHKRTIKPPVITTETILVHDTIDHYIIDQVPYYITKVDSIIKRDTVFREVDTLKILEDYYAIHYYTRIWEDTLVKATLEDAISENRSIDAKFRYKLLKPQTIINKTYDYSTHYDKYIYFGFSLPVYPFKVNEISNINYVGLEATFAYPKGYLRIGWQPYAETFNIGTGIRIAKFKK